MIFKPGVLLSPGGVTCPASLASSPHPSTPPVRLKAKHSRTKNYRDEGAGQVRGIKVAKQIGRSEEEEADAPGRTGMS